MNTFKSKGVVITGAASGIGEALARNLARARAGAPDRRAEPVPSL